MVKNKKILKIIVAILIIVLLSGNSGCSGCSKKENKAKTTNDNAQKKKRERYLTIINKTGQVINEVHITVGEGTEISAAHIKNPKEDSFSVKIPDDYDEYTTFHVILEDRYGFQYEKEVSDVSEKGRTEIKLTEDDKVKQKGDWKRKIDQIFNGD